MSWKMSVNVVLEAELGVEAGCGLLYTHTAQPWR